jgi:LPXTG-site transpeptidase (sortase) family protein
MKKKISKKKVSPRFPLPLALAIVSMASGFLILFFVFFPILWLEVDYTVQSVQYKTTQSPVVKPVSTDFGIVIPKINANAPVVKNVDAFDSKAYQQALSKGIAHAQGTSTPDMAGNTFLFAHSAQNWLNANRYNAVFYLLYKLEKGEKFSVHYKGKEYIYKIEEKKTVSAENVEVMMTSAYPRSVTLMTCWPPGTTFQRLLVVGSLEEVK